MKRLMVVDDEADIARILKVGLEHSGFAVDSFTDPQIALDHFKPDYYAMVITDIKMPIINGFALYRELKKKDEKIKVAFMTAFDIYQKEFTKVMPNISVKMFLTKPIHISDLTARISEELKTV